MRDVWELLSILVAAADQHADQLAGLAIETEGEEPEAYQAYVAEGEELSAAILEARDLLAKREAA